MNHPSTSRQVEILSIIILQVKPCNFSFSNISGCMKSKQIFYQGLHVNQTLSNLRRKEKLKIFLNHKSLIDDTLCAHRTIV